MLATGAGARQDVSKLLLGIAGDPARFQQQTGQKSAINHVFLGWQQGATWGKRLEVYLLSWRRYRCSTSARAAAPARRVAP